MSAIISYHIGNIAGYSIGDLLWEGHGNFRYEKTVEQKRASKVSIRNVLHICVNEETVGITLLSFVEKTHPHPNRLTLKLYILLCIQYLTAHFLLVVICNTSGFNHICKKNEINSNIDRLPFVNMTCVGLFFPQTNDRHQR